MYRGRRVGISEDFSSESKQGRRELSKIFESTERKRSPAKNSIFSKINLQK